MIPDFATEDVRADQLTVGRLICIPMTESMETVTEVAVDGRHVQVYTDGTGPLHSYRWMARDLITAVTR